MTEITLDTNVFLRYLLEDVDHQFEKAKKVIEEIQNGEKTGRISILVINELVWILEKYYGLKRSIYIPKILKILLIDQMKVIEIKKEDLKNILEKFQKQKFDFTDMYLAHIASPERIFSFDKDFEKIKKDFLYLK